MEIWGGMRLYYCVSLCKIDYKLVNCLDKNGIYRCHEAKQDVELIAIGVVLIS